MTKEDYVLFAGADLALIEEVAALAGKTGKELVEYISGSSIRGLEELIESHLGEPRNAVTQVNGNVIHVNFSASSAASRSDLARYKGSADRRASGSRLRATPTTVPSASPNSHAKPVSSTSPDTVLPYSSR